MGDQQIQVIPPKEPKASIPKSPPKETQDLKPNSSSKSEDFKNFLEFDAYDRPLLTAYLDKAGDQPLIFRFDSAASRTVLYSSSAYLLGLETLSYQTRRVYTATGYRYFPIFETGDLRSLGLVFPLKNTVALSDPEDGSAIGLLGVDVFRDRILKLDFERGKAGILANSSDIDMAKYHEIKGRKVARGFLAVNITISGVDIPAVVDTGASHTVANPAATALIERISPDNQINPKYQKENKYKRPVRQVTAAGGVLTGSTLKITNARIGSEIITDIDIVSGDLPIFQILGARQAPAMILGMDILGRRNLILDFERYRLYVGHQSIKVDEVKQ